MKQSRRQVQQRKRIAPQVRRQPFLPDKLKKNSTAQQTLLTKGPEVMEAMCGGPQIKAWVKLAADLIRSLHSPNLGSASIRQVIHEVLFGCYLAIRSGGIRDRESILASSFVCKYEIL